MSRLLITAFGLFIGISAASLSSEAVTTHRLDIRFIVFKNSRWTELAIKENLAEARNIYEQCGIQIGSPEYSKTTETAEEIYFDLEGYSEPGEKHHETGALNFAKKYSRPDKVNILFFERFEPEYGHIPATAVPATRISQPDQQPALNTVWMPYLAEINRMTDISDGGTRDGFNTLAHEIGHLLLDDTHVNLPRESNLMHEMRSNLNGRLTREQCMKMKQSKLLVSLPKNNARLCPELQSPLMRDLFISKIHDNSNSTIMLSQDCQKIDKILNDLETLQDQVSDLLPVKSVDFYFTTQANEISHLDRKSFSANLDLTYDMHGKIKLPYSQERILWWHEMGHAILNEQLATDWPWFNKRLALYRRWGEAISASTRLEIEIKNKKLKNEIDKLNQEIEFYNKQSTELLKQIHQLDNSVEFEDLLGPYHEMFADAVVILHTQNPKSIRFGLSDPQDPDAVRADQDEKAELEDRDYSYVRDPNSWNKDEVHNLLTPALSIWWNRISQNKEAMANKPQTLRFLYYAILNEVRARSADSRLLQLNPAEVNQRLIKSFTGVNL